MNFGGKQTLSLQNLALGKKVTNEFESLVENHLNFSFPFFYTRVQGQGHEPKIFSYWSDSANKKGFAFWHE